MFISVSFIIYSLFELLYISALFYYSVSIDADEEFELLDPSFSFF